MAAAYGPLATSEGYLCLVRMHYGWRTHTSRLGRKRDTRPAGDDGGEKPRALCIP
jgi:hypothetical protein